MPTYEYKCKNCGYSFDAFQGMNDLPLKTCSSCHTDSLKRLIGTGAGILFKGSGFYQTDYRSDSYIKAQKKENDSNKPKTTDSKEKEKTKAKPTKAP